jgi:hypothetical protein
VPKKNVALVTESLLVTPAMLIRKVAIPWVNGLCGLLPAIEAFADAYVPETAGLPISRCQDQRRANRCTKRTVGAGKF